MRNGCERLGAVFDQSLYTPLHIIEGDSEFNHLSWPRFRNGNDSLASIEILGRSSHRCQWAREPAHQKHGDDDCPNSH